MTRCVRVGSAAICALLGCSGCGAADSADPVPPQALSIAAENALPGSRGFEVTNPAAEQLSAYASLVSAAAGDSVDLLVNVDVPDEVRFELYRLGYYQGKGARLVLRGAAAHVVPQPDCPVDAATGLIECHWQRAFSVDIDAGYTSGYYLFKLISARGIETRVPLVVREDVPKAPIVVQASVNTWQAYNYWGGTSLYVNLLPAGAAYKRSRALRVSYDRPYALAAGAGPLFEQEIWLARWLEREGYEVAYVTNIDVDREPELLKSRKIAISVGHDEYNSVTTRSAFEAARDSGVSIAYLSANAGYWRVRQDASSDGVPARIVTCYKDAQLDPLRDSLNTTTEFRQYPFAHPEGELEGVMYQTGNTPPSDLPLVVAAPNSWVLAGTGAAELERLGNVLGPEWDQLADVEAPAGTEIILDSPAVRKLGGFSRAQATVYYPSDDNFVFAAGTIDWARALAEPDSIDVRVQRITQNLLARAGLPPKAWMFAEPARSELASASQVTVLAGTGEAGFVDGPAESAQFNAPTGIALGADGALYVSEVQNHSVRRIAADGSVSTVAGCLSRAALTGRFRDGVRRRACFDTPTAILAMPNGSLLVSDTLSNRIRLIDAAGRVSTFAGTGAGGLLDSADRRSARLLQPHGLALGKDGSVYIAEPQHGALRRISPDGAVSTLLTDAVGLSGVAVGDDDSVYLANWIDGTISRWVDGRAEPIVNLARTPGDRSGAAPDAALRPAEGLVLDGSRLVIADMGNYRLRELDLSTGRVATLAGDGRAGLDVAGPNGVHLVLPRGVVKYRDGYAVADTGNHRIVYVRR